MVRADGYVKVLDFGLARVIDQQAAERSTRINLDTAPGTRAGHRRLHVAGAGARAPRPARPPTSSRSASSSTRWPAGRRPFVGAVERSACWPRSCRSSRSRSCGSTRRFPPAFDALVHRMLAKEPERRPSAREVDEASAALQRPRRAVEPAAPAAPSRRARRSAARPSARELRRAYGSVAGRPAASSSASPAKPGIGKTSLVEDFLAELTTRPERPIVARGRCSERLAGAEAYLPILEALDSLLHRRSGESLQTLMKTVAPTWYLQVATRSVEESSMAQPARRRADRHRRSG